MANSTDEYLSVNGVSLQTLAFNVETWGGDKEAPPPLRGDDITIPYAAGRMWTPRVVDSRTITLSMWVIGADSNGFAPSSGTRRAEFEKNWKMLRSLLWTPDAQITLTKRFRPYGSTTVTTASAKAQYIGGLRPSMQGRERAMFTVDLLLSDPYFYGSEIELDFAAGATTRTITPTILGDARTTDIDIDFLGARSTPKLTNSSLGHSVTYDEGLAAGNIATLDVKGFDARWGATAPATSRRPGRVIHAGNPHWMTLAPGVQTLTLTGESGTGGASLRYRPAYI